MHRISVRPWRFGLTVLGSLCAGLASLTAGHAQSLDPKNPAPLAPGVNKGNVDSFTGAHYFYFEVKPGHFDAKMAFREMGLFGAPHRQSLSFDFYNDAGKLVSHNAIVSAASLERTQTGADVVRGQRVVLAIIPQQGAIRLGGYYEIELTGTVELAGTAGASAGVAPQSTELVHPGTTLVQPAGPLVQQGTLVQPQTLVQPTGPLVQPVGPLVQPGGPLVTPGGPLVKPGGVALLNMKETEKEIRVSLSADVLFDFDKSNIRPDAAESLEQVAAVIREKNRGVVRIEGHTDAKGSDPYNQRLSDARARAVKDWLVSQDGFRPALFSTSGFAARRPVAPNTKPDGSDDPEGRQRNRRVELVIAK
jgi:outer membrane protein OmpA-like peptidoglycan-associated protein